MDEGKNKEPTAKEAYRDLVKQLNEIIEKQNKKMNSLEERITALEISILKGGN